MILRIVRHLQKPLWLFLAAVLTIQPVLAAQYSVTKELVEALKAASAPPPIVAKLESAIGKSAVDKDAFLKLVAGLIGEEGLDTPLGEIGTIKSVVVRWADPRIGQEVSDTRKLNTPLRTALGDAEFDKAMSSGEYQYIGNLACRVCHREFFLGRKKDAHAKALQSGIPKTMLSEERCLFCHTTGYKVATGFVDVKTTPKTRDITCEGCHGPGSKHEKEGKAGGFLAGAQQPDKLKKMCVACHTGRWNHAFGDVDASYKNYKDAEASANKK